ncbi:PhnD/SsuA/transferrin family substrate-binding protein [Rhodobacterales bacterium HKCCE4037]|nr:PhnD/SsuA/transferrin family substrate-binding protein [Rhodobacterales bacterium HKCCE4037]
MIASLPMYLRAETRRALDDFWKATASALRNHGIAAPDALDHDAPVFETWGRSDLVLGQICNLPYRTHFHDHVTLIAAADFGLPGAGPGHYYSHIIARADDARETLADFDGAQFALNGTDSQSGWGAAWMLFQDHDLSPGSYLGTGAHVNSARAVAEGRADFASIDAQTWALIEQFDPVARRLRIIARTPESPGISFITAGDVDPTPYRAALAEAFAACPRIADRPLGMRAAVPLPAAAYTGLPIPPRPIDASQG